VGIVFKAVRAGGYDPCLHLSKPTMMGLEMTENEDIRSEGTDL
jgi:hypothetical protein